MTDQQPSRTPYCHKIRYGITGAPILDGDDMDGSHAPGVGLAPKLIELVYSSARDGKPARVDASVTGDWTRFGEPDDFGGQVATHFKDGPDGWPAWLAEEARLHDPAAVPSVSAVDQTTRDRIAEAQVDRAAEELAALAVNAGRALSDEKRHYEIACHENARLRATVERVRRLHAALDAETDLTSPDDEITRGAAARKIAAALDGWTDPAELRRLADEARQPDTETRPAWTPGPVALARAAEWAAKRQDATVDPAVAERPRCPHCQMPHDLSPGSSAVLACASIRASIADRDAASAVLGRSAADTEAHVAPHCDGFPTTCPNPVTVPPAPPQHGGGIRCGCYDEDSDQIVGYRLAGLNLYCTGCTPSSRGDIWEPVTSEDLPDGGVCARCCVDVLIPQDGAES